MIANNKKMDKFVAFALVIMLVFVVAFSEYFIHREANHDCHDETCPICVVINQSNNILSNVLRSNFLNIIGLVLLFYTIKLFNINQNVFTFSLIDNNVRLNE